MPACSFLFVFLVLASLQVSLEGYSLVSREGGALSSAAANLGGTSAGEVEFSTVVQGWSAVPWAFSKCRSTFEQRPSAKLATQAIITLESSTKIVVAQHGTCKLCRSLGTQSTYYLEFEQIIRQIFVSWQSVLIDGAQKYPQEWRTTIGLGFKTFASFLTTIHNMCISLQIDLPAIFRSIHLNYQVFNEVGLNLVQILKLNVGISVTGKLPQASTQPGNLNAMQPQPHIPIVTAPAPGTPANYTPPHGSVQSIANLPGTNFPAPGTHSPVGLGSGATKSLGQTPTQPGGQGLAVIVQGWYGLPIAFGKCKAVFDKKVSDSIALQAVGTLHATVQSAILRYGTCKSCISSNAKDAPYTEFLTVLREIFTVWQSLLLVGEQQYKAEWSSSFKPEFAKFDQFLLAVYDISSSIKLDLYGLFTAIHLKAELFLSAGLSLSSRFNIPQLGGLIGGKLQAPTTPAVGGVSISGAVAPGLQAPVPAAGGLSPTLRPTAPVPNEPGENELLLVIQGWSTLPKAFVECQAAFQRRVSINLAIQAVATLHATVQSAISQYGSCVQCAGLAANSPILIKFRDLIAQIFASWQSVLEVGQRSYQLQWRSSIGLEFRKFYSFWAVIKNLSASVRLNLGTLLSSIHFRASAFADIGIDVNLQLNLGAGSNPQALQATTSKIPAHDVSTLVYGWASLPSAFARCQSSLESHASINVAFQAIDSLHSTFQWTISNYGSCNSCNTPYPQSALAVRFRGIISQIFISWQKIISIGRINYAAQWKNLSVEFKQFSPFLLSVKDICSSLKINLGILFGEIRLNANLFMDVGINLSAHFNLNLGGRIGAGNCGGNFLNLGFNNCLLDGFKRI